MLQYDDDDHHKDGDQQADDALGRLGRFLVLLRPHQLVHALLGVLCASSGGGKGDDMGTSRQDNM